MKKLFLFFLLIFPIICSSKTEFNDSSDYFVIFYNYHDSSIKEDCYDELFYTFKSFSELEKILISVPDNFNAIKIRFDSNFSLPNNLLKFKHLKYLIIETSIIFQLADQINQLTNLRELYINCDTIYNLPYSLTDLKNLIIVEIVADKYYPKKLKRKIRRIVKNSKSEFSSIWINWYYCSTDQSGKKIECIDFNKY